MSEWEASRSLMNTLRETQVEHGTALGEIASAAGVLVTEQAQQGQALDQQARVLSTHSEALAELVAGRREHTDLLAQQGQALAEILRRLPPAAGN